MFVLAIILVVALVVFGLAALADRWFERVISFHERVLASEVPDGLALMRDKPLSVRLFDWLASR